ncbi:hypothetical protein F3Y22_tig00112813pilonHSYRG00048 [Hibiscus syriacus]|uniref:Auxin efflux carrier family protein n=1 Tax=Hibiscus syriacus TaxID=106335 RepID=A0A6A2WSQ4_HIBSY|nr:hypothetical protein F3Y22_tig00112813pilonHSYRG00048 [Hibiscus syriacus]
MATDYCKLLPEDTRRYLNKLVFVVFTPSLMFASLAKTVTLQDIISWWFMPVNVGITYLVGGIVGWIVVKILRPKPHLEGLIIATCSSGNMGNLLLIVVPAICNEDGSPFGNRSVCNSVGLSYASFSLAIGGFYVWTISYQMVKTSAMKLKAAEEFAEPNNESDATVEDPASERRKGSPTGDSRLHKTSRIRYTPGYRHLGRKSRRESRAPIVRPFVPLRLDDSVCSPPASNIGTITQLFGVGQEECSVLFLWTYLIAALALTTWSTIFMWILT